MQNYNAKPSVANDGRHHRESISVTALLHIFDKKINVELYHLFFMSTHRPSRFQIHLPYSVAGSNFAQLDLTR